MPNSKLLAVKIATLPTFATLLLNGTAVKVGQSIPAAEIASGHLQFTNTSLEWSFAVPLQDDGGSANGGVDLEPAPHTITARRFPCSTPPSGIDQ